MTDFRILQCDPGAAQYLSWAKKKAQALIDSGFKSFDKVYETGDATVRIKADEWTVKLFLAASKIVDYVGVAMPNPVPYRGVNIGVVAGATYVMASDGTVLASEVQNTSGGHIYYVPDTAWNGEGYVNMYVDDPTIPPVNHQLTFTVPEDCVYPAPTATASIFTGRRKAWFKKNSDEFIAALKGKFQPGAAGVTRAELQIGSLPASWDHLIKSSVHRSLKTYQPNPVRVISGPTYTLVDYNTNTDGIGSWFANFTGTITLGYNDSNGNLVQQTFAGTLNIIGTMHIFTDSGGDTYQQPHTVITYVNFPMLPDTATGEAAPFVYDWIHNPTLAATIWNPAGGGSRYKNEPRIYDQYHGLSRDNGTALFGLLNGSYTASDYVPFSQIGLGLDTQPSISVPMFGSVRNGQIRANITTPPFPADSGIVRFSNPQFLLDWVKANPPKYHSTTPSTTYDGNTAWNNSALYNVKQVDLLLFGPVQADGTILGIFPDPTDADGCTRIAYCGEARFAFDWSIGTLTWKNWSPKQDKDGNDAPKIISLPAGFSYFNNNGALYLVELVKTTIAGTGQTPTAAGQAAYTAVSHLNYQGISTAAAIIQSAVTAAAPIDPNASPLVASPANITAALPSAVTQAVAAVLAAYVSPATPPDAVQVKYAILNAIQTLQAAYNCAVGYGWDKPADLWPDVLQYHTSTAKTMKSGGGDQVLYSITKQ